MSDEYNVVANIFESLLDNSFLWREAIVEFR